MTVPHDRTDERRDAILQLLRGGQRLNATQIARDIGYHRTQTAHQLKKMADRGELIATHDIASNGVSCLHYEMP